MTVPVLDLRLTVDYHNKPGALRDVAIQIWPGEVLGLVGMPNPTERLHDYPHQLSGGLRQRVMMLEIQTVGREDGDGYRRLQLGDRRAALVVGRRYQDRVAGMRGVDCRLDAAVPTIADQEEFVVFKIAQAPVDQFGAPLRGG